ncbi:tetratricopeptide repeat protein [Planctomycetota bacterium]
MGFLDRLLGLFSGSAEQYYSRGVSHLEAGRYGLALADFIEAIQRDPNHAEAYARRATVLRMYGRCDEAEADFAKAKELGLELVEPDADKAREWWQKGRSLAGRGEHDQAIACFSRALDLDPADTANYAERGHAYLLKGDADAAIADFTQFIRAIGDAGGQRRPISGFRVDESGDVTIVTFTGSGLVDQEAIEDIGEQLLSLVDELGRRRIVLDLASVKLMSSAALGRLVVLHKRLRVVGGRLALCNIVPEIHEALVLTKLNMLFRIEPHPLEDAGGELSTQASRLTPPSAAEFLECRTWRTGLAIAYANRGAAHSFRGNNDAAIADYTEAIRLHPTFAGVYVNRGNAYASKGDYRRAIADYTEAIRLQPRQVGQPNAYGERARAYRALGDEDQAVRDERSMSACDHSARAEALLLQGELEQAISAYTDAIRLDPTSERYAAQARAFQAKQDYGRAIDDYSEAVRLDPQDATLYLMRAAVYRLRGDEALAMEDERRMEELRK